jgi:hypothetical protein
VAALRKQWLWNRWAAAATAVAAVLNALPLLGCSPTITHYRNAINPQFRQAELDRDQYQCRRENSIRVLQANAYATWASRTETDNSMVQQCLAARGWHPD